MMKLFSLLIVIAFCDIYNVMGFGENVEVDVSKLRNDEELKRHFHASVLLYNRNRAAMYVPYQVHSIKKQLVAGILYKFEVTMVGSKCKKMQQRMTLIDCKYDEDLPARKVIMKTNYRPWLADRGQQYNFELEKDEEAYNVELHDQLYVVGIQDGESVSGSKFGQFKKKFGKKYKSIGEEKYRLDIFHSNFKKAMLLKMLEKGTADYGTTEFSDYTYEEFRATRLTPAWDLTKKPRKLAPITRMAVPSSVDWREKGAVTPVKNQGSCGSCWAFSTTGNIEGQWFKKTKKLVSLSEQQLVDCDKVDSGCNGGLPSQAYKSIEKMGGLETESEYPYDAHNEQCHFKKSEVRAYINDSVSISTDESQMTAWCAQNGPISIGINAFAMQFYRGGISHPFKLFCNPNHLDHGVLIVGYSVTSAGEPYWIVKNSWGPNWGVKGYYLVYRGSGVCGLNKMPTSATIA